MKIGIISDTHDLLRPEVFDIFAGVDHILHAGDVGDRDILVELGAIAPITAVWGNTDDWRLRADLPEVARVDLGGLRCLVVHGQQFGSPTPEKLVDRHTDVDLIAFGHTHEAVIRRIDDVLVVNPGSAGPARFRTTPTVATARVENGGVDAELIRIPAAMPRSGSV